VNVSVMLTAASIAISVNTGIITSAASVTTSVGPAVTNSHSRQRSSDEGKYKDKSLGTCYSAAYMSRLKTSSALQSRK